MCCIGLHQILMGYVMKWPLSKYIDINIDAKIDIDTDIDIDIDMCVYFSKFNKCSQGRILYCRKAFNHHFTDLHVYT